MSNQTYNDYLYNKEQKERFLKDRTFNTREAYSRVLKRASSLEEEFGKDLYNFNISEIELLINYLAPTTLSSVQSATSPITVYIDWAIEQGLRTDNFNPLSTLIDREYLEKFIDKSNELIFSKDDIDDITGRLTNRIDAAVIQCLFEGLMGKKYSELLNLTIHDINENENRLILTNDIDEGHKKKRVLMLDGDSTLIKLLIQTFEKKIYYKNNGNPSPNNKSDIINLVENDYIFRAAALGVKYLGKADSHLVLRKLRLVADWMGQPHLTATNIRNSGMLYYAYKLYKDRGKLEKEEYDIICERFDIKMNSLGYYNISRQKNDFLNVKTIEKIYGKGTS
ncbi:hypothetical protein [Paenibacillus sp. FSL H3-0286]|uniref:phage lytic cycle repressor MrpR family protein n=1 Tax=Paenibacillus sp. FSL H3-0286 TaxID=2921427 RepID=UPI0032560F3C